MNFWDYEKEFNWKIMRLKCVFLEVKKKVRVVICCLGIVWKSIK